MSNQHARSLLAAPASAGGSFSGPAPSPGAPFQRDDRFVLGARPKTLQAAAAPDAAAPGGAGGSFSPAAAPSPGAPFQRDDRFVLGARPKGLQADAGSFVPAPAPSPTAPFHRNDKYTLGARPRNVSALAAEEASGGGAFARGDKYALPARPRNATFVRPNEPDAAAAIEAVDPTAFVQTQGTDFVVAGRIRYFSGSNGYFLILRNYLTDAQVVTFFKVMAGNGVDLIRTWGFLNGAQDPYAVGVALQPSIGVYDELSLQRLDLVLSEAAKNGVYIILPLVNYWSDLGGMQWYVDQVLGTGHALENFYTNPKVKQAYKNYVTKIVTRKNSITGTAYSADPAIFAWELANEPRTSKGYEDSLGLPRGSLIKAWIAEMAAFIRSIDSHHMISTGEEGFLNQKGGATWMEDGSEGGDYAANLADPNIAFGTAHCYPSNFGIPASSASAFLAAFISSRAAVAQAAGKPFILEETGMDPSSYAIYRPDYYAAAFGAAKAADAKAMLPWELVAWHVAPTDSGGFDFGPDDVSYAPVASAIAYQKTKTACANSGTCGAPAAACACGDVAPSSDFTCVEQFGYHGIAMCSYSWMGPGFCDATCGRCIRCTAVGSDTPPSPAATKPPAAPGAPVRSQTPAPSGGSQPPATTAAPALPGSAGTPPCHAAIVVGPVWGQGGSEEGATIQIALTAPGSVGIPTPYTLTYSGGAPILSAGTWDWDAYVTGSIKSSYMALLPGGGSTARTGFTVYFSDAQALAPTSLTINGDVCSMSVTLTS